MLGNMMVTLALMTSVFTVVMYYLNLKGYDNTIKLARLGYHATALLVVAACVLLMYAILNHQYQYKYVFNYSGGGLPFGLLMSTFYAGQEGSFMLWLLFSTLVGIFLLEFTSRRRDLEPRVMAIFTLTISFLLIMVNPLLKSPFNLIWSEPTFIDVSKFNQSMLSLPFLQNFFFSDPNSNTNYIRVGKDLAAALNANGIDFNTFLIHGKGLNPLLQNFWMQIHPPFLFMGFALSSVPFVFAFAALVKNEYKDWVNHSLPWVLTSMMVLGFAIMLGGYWAYGVLGWGGYWGWDPVENSSLAPWIIGVALIHTMLVQKKSQSNGKTPRFVKTNLILAIMTYTLVLYSTFLTRSGVLGDASVHSFVDPGMIIYLFLICLVSVFAILGFGGIIYRWKFLEANFTAEENFLSRELALFTGAVALIASAIIILVGTSAPIFGTSVDTQFYNELNLPLAIIMGLINGLSLFLSWKRTNGKNLLKNIRLSLGLTIVSTIIIAVFGGVHNIMLLIFTFTTLFALFVNIETAVKIMKGKLSHLGAFITHAGLAFFFLGVIATGGYSEHTQVELVKNKPKNVLGYDLTFTGWKPFDHNKKYHFNVLVDHGGSQSTVSPVMFIADFNNSLMREPDIVSRLTKDFYISPVSYDDGKSSNSSAGKSVTMNKGETYEYNGALIKFVGFDFPKDAMDKMMKGGKFVIGINLEATYNGKTIPLKPALNYSGGNRTPTPAKWNEADLQIIVSNLNAAGKVDLILSTLSGDVKTPAQPKESLVIEASIKPFIGLVWLGVIVMALGFLVAIFRRTREIKI